MPASSKAQQRFFGVVKAMQKGDIPKTGKAGKIAKTMDKDDVDKYASTKHKGKPEKVKREQRVRELIKKMVREELNKMNEKKLPLKTATKSHYINLIKKELESKKGQLAYAQDKVNYKGTPDWEKKEFKGVLKDLLKKLKDSEKHYKRVQKLKEGKLNETWDGPQGWSSKEAKEVVDGALKNYAKELRKVQYKVVKDWMSKAKGGVIDFFDIQRGLTTGDISRAHPYETSFLQKVLTRDKIISRFRSYFGGKKGFEKRRKNQRGM